jgi:hypothetical protein
MGLASTVVVAMGCGFRALIAILHRYLGCGARPLQSRRKRPEIVDVIA